jgi:CRP/FNR family transcriptional regulator
VLASRTDILAAYPCLEGISADSRDELRRHGRPIAAGPALFRQEGDACNSVTLLDAGLVRVVKRRASGREVTLYTFGPGEVCALEVLAVLVGTPYRAEAIIEEAVSGIAVPADVFRAVAGREPELRAHLLRSIEGRLAFALDMVGDVALGSLEARLAGLVLRHAGGSADIHLTHERLAAELACAREAVSRILGAWERAGHVRLGRAHVCVLDVERLAELAGDAGPDPRT